MLHITKTFVVRSNSKWIFFFFVLICTDGSKLEAIKSLEGINENFLTTRANPRAIIKPCHVSFMRCLCGIDRKINGSAN
jgi:hypothetical protein